MNRRMLLKTAALAPILPVLNTLRGDTEQDPEWYEKVPDDEVTIEALGIFDNIDCIWYSSGVHPMKWRCLSIKGSKYSVVTNKYGELVHTAVEEMAMAYTKKKYSKSQYVRFAEINYRDERPSKKIKIVGVHAYYSEENEQDRYCYFEYDSNPHSSEDDVTTRSMYKLFDNFKG